MLETMGTPVHKFGALIETKGVSGDSYKIFDKHPGLNKEFDMIFSYDEEILDKYSNANFVPFCAGVNLDFEKSYDLEYSKNLMNPLAYLAKNKNISILSSAKEMCELHILRKKTAFYLKEKGLADTYGTFDGGCFIRAYDTLHDYRYSFVFENTLSDYCFTEKITNCFAMQTIPIYLGATKIHEFFNPDGIIHIDLKDLNDIESIVKKCTLEFYEERKEAILDNYNRVHNFLNIEDFMYKTYLQNILR